MFQQDQKNRQNLSLHFKPYFQLIRPANVLIGMMSIAVGALVAGSFSPLINILFACLSGGFITAAANSINDYYDINIDKINKPFRPLASGQIQLNHAKIFALFLFFTGLVLALFIRPLALLIALLSTILLYLYSSHFKRIPLWGNVVVAFITGLAFIYGGVAVYKLKIAIIPAGFAFFYHLGREILKDIEDLEGDKSDHAITFPIRFGLNPSRWLITIIFLLLIFLTFLPYIYKIFGIIYLLVVCLGVNLFLLFVIISLWRNPSKENLHRLSEWLRLDMLVGLLAILAGVYLS